MRKKWPAFFFALLAISAWALVLITLTRDTPMADGTLPTVAVLPTQQPSVTAPSPTAQTIAQRPSHTPTETLPPTATLFHTATPLTAQSVAAEQVVIHFAPDTPATAREDYLRQAQVEVVQEIPVLNAVVISQPTEAALPESPHVATTEPDYYAHALFTTAPDDPYYDDQWGLHAIGAPQVWPTLPDAPETIIVAVIDSGVCLQHPDLQQRILSGYDFIVQNTRPNDQNGHGCAVAGVIAANIANGTGIAGIAPNVQILPVRVLDANGSGTYSTVAAGIIYAVDNGAQIINLSLGGPQPGSILADAIAYAAAHDVLVIAAAGNTGDTQVYYPAAYETVIAVGAINASLTRSGFSTYGPDVNVLAPGEDILSTALDGTYSVTSGSSLAAPHVAGLAAIEIARGQQISFDGGIARFKDALPATPAPTALPPTPLPEDVPPEYQALMDKVKAQGRLRVIVSLNVPFQPPIQLSETQAQQQSASVNQLRQQVISGLSQHNAVVLSQSDQWVIPAVSLGVNADALRQLIYTPQVASIQEDIPLAPTLVDSVPRTKADVAHSYGYTGSSQTIAILDTGIDANHINFEGRVVNEACYSSTYYGTDSSLCPNGQNEQYGSGAAGLDQCYDTDGDCDHGTHVAGIAAGQNGIASDANIMAVQVFFKQNDPADCLYTAPCVSAYQADVLSGLNYVYGQRHNYDIAAVNLSLGGGFYTTACDATYTYFRDAAALLNSVDIAVIAASGNGAEKITYPYYEHGITVPACINGIVSVGSTITANDQISTFSQSAPILDLLAPGEVIESSVPNNSTAYMQGTSMAAPHVAGAWAILRQAGPFHDNESILQILQSTGKKILDMRFVPTRNFTRIDIAEALFSIGAYSTYTVNSTSDTYDGQCNAVHCSLREALTLANNPLTGYDLILFDIPGPGPHVINITKPLPAIQHPITIYGTSQPGYNSTPLIQINGSKAGNTSGLAIKADSTIITGLSITNFRHHGISIQSSYNYIQSSYIGVAPNGTAQGNRQSGIAIEKGVNNVIGGNASNQRNVISGNQQHGISLSGPASITYNNRVTGNYIGTTVNGMDPLPNKQSGIYITTPANFIGGGDDNGFCSLSCNLINYNQGYGIHITTSNAYSNLIEGNVIGLKISGESSTGNQKGGILLDQAQSNSIINNTVITNSGPGITLTNDASYTVISENDVSANALSGIRISASQSIDLIQNRLYHNYGPGLLIEKSTHYTYVADNEITENSSHGIQIQDSNIITINSNYIGTTLDGNTAGSNNGHGIQIKNSNNVYIGLSNNPNHIRYNDGDGIRILSGTNNQILTNIFSDNGGLAVDLGGDGVTPNDPHDADKGPNDLLNTPVITRFDLLTETITGTYQGKPNSTINIIAYGNDVCDPSGYGEGLYLLETIQVYTGVSGQANFSIDVNGLPHHQLVTAIAYDQNNNSSEFSNCVAGEYIFNAPLDAVFEDETLVRLIWEDTLAAETDWHIERSPAGLDDWEEIITLVSDNPAGTGQEYQIPDNTFLCGKAYDYRVRAYTNTGYYTTYTPVATAQTTCEPLLPPTNFSLSADSASQISMSWDNPNNTATGYQLDYSFDDGSTWQPLVTLPAHTMTYLHSGLMCDSSYAYRIRAQRDHEGTVSTTTGPLTQATLACTPLTAPANFTVVDSKRTQITLSWALIDPQQAINGIVVDRFDSANNLTYLPTMNSHITTVTDSGLSCGQTYIYRIYTYRSQDATASPINSLSASTQPCPAPVNHTLGLYTQGTWQFWRSNQTGAPAVTFNFGPAETGWQPIIGDWDGDGNDGIGLYKNGTFLLRNATSTGSSQHSFSFGPTETGWQPIVGDWDGDGNVGIGLYKNGTFLLRQTATSGPPDLSFTFGPETAGYQPVAGDWDGSGSDSVGLYKDGTWLLSNSLPARSDIAPFSFGQTQPGWFPLTGDWDGNGTVTVGVYKNHLWHLRNSNTSGTPDLGYSFALNNQPWQPTIYNGDLSILAGLAQEPGTQTSPTPHPTAEPTTGAPTINPTDSTAEATSDATAIPPTPLEATPDASPEIATETPAPSPTATETPVPASPPPATATEPPPVPTATEMTAPLPTEAPPNAPPEITEEA